MVDTVESKWYIASHSLTPFNVSVVFAHQGYFVVMINPTGSTTFGQGASLHVLIGTESDDSLEFTDAIAKDWGGKPFIDLINGWKDVIKNYPEVWHMS